MLPRKFKKGLQACNIIKKETPTLLFFSKICEIFKNRTPPLVASTCQTTLIALRESNNWLLAVNSFMTDYHIQASLLIHRASQWTGFFMLRPSVTNKLIFARKQLTVFANKLYLTGHLILLVCYTRLSFEHEMLLLINNWGIWQLSDFKKPQTEVSDIIISKSLRNRFSLLNLEYMYWSSLKTS